MNRTPMFIQKAGRQLLLETAAPTLEEAKGAATKVPHTEVKIVRVFITIMEVWEPSKRKRK